MENRRYTEQRVPKGDISPHPPSSRRHQEMFYPQSDNSQRGDAREPKSTRFTLLQESYRSLPSVTLERDHREKNMHNKLLRHNIIDRCIYPALQEVRRKMWEIHPQMNKKPGDGAALDDLKKCEGLLQEFLHKRQGYEEKLLQKVRQLKKTLKDVRLFISSQSSGKEVDLARELGGIFSRISTKHMIFCLLMQITLEPMNRGISIIVNFIHALQSYK